MEHPIVITSDNRIEDRSSRPFRYSFGFMDGYFTPSYVVNGANPAAKIKHIIKFIDGYC